MSKYVAIFALLALMAMPAVGLNTLYGQEGTTADGYTPINAAGKGPATNPNSTNWQYQYGGTNVWSAVYSWDTDAWVEEYDNGVDGTLDIECDIEMFVETTITDPKLYFHFGNPKNLTYADRLARVLGSLWCNNGQWIGMQFLSKDPAKFATTTTDGIIKDAMVGTIDIGNRAVNDSFDVKILMNDFMGGGSRPPDNYGAGAHGTILASLWWLVNGGAPGSYSVAWYIEMLPKTFQKDGNYDLDPIMVVTPEM